MTATRAPVTAEQLTVIPANEASWEDLAAIFGATDYPGRCQCQRFKVAGWIWRAALVWAVTCHCFRRCYDWSLHWLFEVDRGLMRRTDSRAQARTDEVSRRLGQSEGGLA